MSADIKLSDAAEARRVMQKAIADAVRQFESMTGLHVDRIDLSPGTMYETVNGQLQRVSQPAIHVEVRL